MKTRRRLQKIVTSTSALALFMTMMAAVPTLLEQPNHAAEAHFLGTTKEVDNYKVAFEPTPLLTKAGENTTLHFSVLKDNANVGNVYAAMQIKEKQTGKIVEQLPYKLYEISDISIPYTFQNNTDYSVTLLMRTYDGNAQHMARPLEADFEVVAKERPIISPMELLAGAVPFTAAMVGGVFLIFKKVK
jgi:hypothetical protein